MRPISSRTLRAVVLTVIVAAPCAAADDPRDGRLVRAEALHRAALGHIARNTIESRRLAIDELERATLLRPEEPSWELTLARLYAQCGYLKQARQRFERVTALRPDEPEARLGLARMWRRDWLKFLDTSSLDRAVEHLSHAARVRPGAADAWLELVPLLVELGDLRAAAGAAGRAREASPVRLEARLAEAYTAYRLGFVGRADSLFSATVPRLPAPVRERFEDISPLATERDTVILHRLAPDARRAFVERFWRELDPDLASAVNEARLEYWSRVAHAFFLFWDDRIGGWDERGEVYVRYGAPRFADYNPLGVRLMASFSTGPGYPVNVLAWSYPELGMTVSMHDRTLNEIYTLPVSMTRDMDPLPNPDSVRIADGRLAARSGRAVFPTLPPRVEPRPVDGAIARFGGDPAPRLLAQVSTAAEPGEGLEAEWVVLDSARHEVVRAARRLGPSACDPTGAQVADFAANLPPGEYLVGLTVRDALGRRGLYRADVALPAAGPGLRLSDVVVTCGAGPALPGPDGAPAVRIEPNPTATVGADGPLTAYFEVYGLALDAGGRARFETSYTVRSAERDRRLWIQRALSPRSRIAPLQVTREEEQAGDLRRQFVLVPVQGLPAGRYRLEILVRDLLAWREAREAVEFTIAGSAAPGP